MRRLVLLLVLAVLVLGAVVADGVVEARAEDEVVAAVRSRVANVGDVDAEVDSFPFTGRLLVQERVSRLRVDLTDVGGYGLDVASLRIVADDIELDRDVLLEGRVQVTGVGRVRAEARISEDAVGQAAGVDLELLAGGRARATVRGATVTADAEVADGSLRFSLEGLPAISVPLPIGALLPCEPEVEVVQDALLATCEAEQLPEILLSAIG